MKRGKRYERKVLDVAETVAGLGRKYRKRKERTTGEENNEREGETRAKMNEKEKECVEGRRQTQRDIYLMRRGAGKMEETGVGR